MRGEGGSASGKIRKNPEKSPNFPNFPGKSAPDARFPRELTDVIPSETLEKYREVLGEMGVSPADAVSLAGLTLSQGVAAPDVPEVVVAMAMDVSRDEQVKSVFAVMSGRISRGQWPSERDRREARKRLGLEGAEDATRYISGPYGHLIMH